MTWLWSSHTWTRREKIIATLLVPGGIVLPLLSLLFSLATRASDCTNFGGPGQPTITHCAGRWLAVGSSSTVIQVVLVVVPVIVAVNLEKVRRSRQTLNG